MNEFINERKEKHFVLKRKFNINAAWLIKSQFYLWIGWWNEWNKFYPRELFVLLPDAPSYRCSLQAVPWIALLSFQLFHQCITSSQLLHDKCKRSWKWDRINPKWIHMMFCSYFMLVDIDILFLIKESLRSSICNNIFTHRLPCTTSIKWSIIWWRAQHDHLFHLEPTDLNVHRG